MTGPGSGRFQRRQWRRRFRALRPVLVLVVVLAVVAGGAWAIWFSSLLAVRSVVVRGERTISRQQVVRSSGIVLGTPLARLNLSGASTAIAGIPEVANVTVSRSWPHTVTVTITERRPVATVHQGGTWTEMDKHGVLFRQTPHRRRSLPLVQVAPKVGADALHGAATVVVSLPPPLLAQVDRVRARSMDSITLVLRHHRTVRWGSADQSHLKARVLAALLQQRAHVYDVSVPQDPTTSP